MVNDSSKLQKFLEDKDYHALLCFCVEPKDWQEIQKFKVRGNKMMKILKDLKLVEALAFGDGKYYTTSPAKEYIK